MKRMLFLGLLLMFIAGSVWAGGGQVQGDKGKGKVTQVVGP